MYAIKVPLTTAPRSGISPVADGFHLAQQDFICRKANFIARTNAPGWAVGEAALWGHTLSADSDGGIIQTLSLRPQKLAKLKYANRLQTVNRLHYGWQGVNS